MSTSTYDLHRPNLFEEDISAWKICLLSRLQSAGIRPRSISVDDSGFSTSVTIDADAGSVSASEVHDALTRAQDDLCTDRLQPTRVRLVW